MKSKILGLTALCVSVLSAPAQAATILSENFDELTAQLGVTSAGAFQAVGGTNVDIVGAGDGFGYLCAGPESGNCLDLDGTGGNPQGIISAPVTLNPGTNYYLSFDLIGSGRGNTASATVTFGSYSQTFSLASGDTAGGIVTNQLITVGAPTAASLEFSSGTAGQVGLVLDNVLITSCVADAAVGSCAPASVPEPATLALLGLGLAGVGFMRRRKAE